MNQDKSLDNELQAFLLENPDYHLIPPAPIPSPIQLKLYTKSQSLSSHRILLSQLAHAAPLLIPCDFGVKIEDFFNSSDKWSIQKKQKLDPEDQVFLDQKLKEKK